MPPTPNLSQIDNYLDKFGFFRLWPSLPDIPTFRGWFYRTPKRSALFVWNHASLLTCGVAPAYLSSCTALLAFSFCCFSLCNWDKPSLKWCLFVFLRGAAPAVAAAWSEAPLMLSDSLIPALEFCCSPKAGKAWAMLSPTCRGLTLDERGNWSPRNTLEAATWDEEATHSQLQQRGVVCHLPLVGILNPEKLTSNYLWICSQVNRSQCSHGRILR